MTLDNPDEHKMPLVEHLGQLEDGPAIEELYLSVLTRQPSTEERDAAARYLKKNAERRPTALGQMVWSLLASTEFSVNH